MNPQAFIVGGCAFVFMGNAVHSAQVDKPINYRLGVPFKCTGSLWMRAIHGGSFQPMGWLLMQARKGQWVQIRDISDLEDHVTITSPVEALQFARLATSPVTMLGIGNADSIYEIVPRGPELSAMAFGNRFDEHDLISQHDFTAGIVSMAWFMKNRIPKASARLVAGKWEVTRAMVRLRPGLGRGTTYLIHEVISRGGKYRRTETPLKILSPPKYGWQDFTFNDE